MESKAERIAGIIARMIEDGHLTAGQKLPSVRDAAVRHDVSKNTAVDAYDRLVAAGLIESRAGSGFYVAAARPALPPARPAHVAEALDQVSLLREQLNQHHAVRVGDGRPPASWMEGSELGRHLRPRGGGLVMSFEHGYGMPQGYEPLRLRIAQSLAERSVGAEPGQILTTFGANHGFDLIVRFLIEPGDAVLVDSPGYYPLFGKLRLARAQIVPVRRLADGPDIEDFEAKAARWRPKLFFTQTLAHNPTGGSTSLPVQHRLLQAAQRHEILLVEDDTFADLLPPVLPRLAALDQLNRVLYVGTYSKTLSASLRSGFIAGQADLIRQLTDVKMLSVVNSSAYVERLIHELIQSGQYRHHLRRLRERITRATAAAAINLRAIGLGDFDLPAGGYHLWCPLPAGVDDLDLARQAADHSIFLAPASIFTLDRVGYRPAIRVNVAYADDRRFLDFLVLTIGRCSGC